jgi:hypothetical protein
MLGQRSILATAILLLVLVQRAVAQEAATEADSAPVQIRAVLRAYYLNLANQNWDALSTYVLSPKLLERRGAPEDVQMVTKDRTRGRGSSQATARPLLCSSSPSPAINDAAIQVDGDWPKYPYRAVAGLRPEWTSFGCCTSRIAGGSSTPTSLRHRCPLTVNDTTSSWGAA